MVAHDLAGVVHIAAQHADASSHHSKDQEHAETRPQFVLSSGGTLLDTGKLCTSFSFCQCLCSRQV